MNSDFLRMSRRVTELEEKIEDTLIKIEDTSIWRSTNDGSGSGLDADLLDGYQASDLINNKHTGYTVTDLSVGWYTIATNTGDRAIARFALQDTMGGRHQSLAFYASHHFGQDSGNNITVLHYSRYVGTPIRYIRIKDYGTYDGAALQVYIDDASNAVSVYMLGDNFQSSGWVLQNWILDAETPPDVSNYSSLVESARVDLDQIDDGGMVATGEIYTGGRTTQHKVWHAGNDGSGSGLDADKLEGYHGSAYAEPHTFALRESHGYLYATIFNTTEVWDVGNVQPYYLYCTNSSSADRYHRRIKFTTLADRINGYGSAKNSHTHNSLHAGSWNYSYTSYGYIQFGPANTSHAHFNTDRGSFYFYKPTYINGWLNLLGNDINSAKNLTCSGYSHMNDILYVENVSQSYTACVDKCADQYTEVSIRPNGNNKGNLGGSSYYWYMTCSYKEYISSNRDYKTNILPYYTENAYDTIKGLQLYTYQCKDSEFYDISVGAMVQDMPIEMVNVSSDNGNSYDSNSATFIVAGAVQEIQKQIEAADLEDLPSALQGIQDRLSAIEGYIKTKEEAQ